ncbi:MAG: peptidylprolyl isomerase [Defluviitaleaceae bacterium]|nr:peptidylprolyl isomerase [Defluviitaleaceae bacterium]
MRNRRDGFWKKCVVGVFALVLVLALAACTGGPAEVPGPTPTPYEVDQNMPDDNDNGSTGDEMSQEEQEEWDQMEELFNQLMGFHDFTPMPGALANQLAPPAPGEEFAIIHTNFGQIHLRLFHDITPLTVENFVTHARNGFYDGLIFHRVMENFMIQGGCSFGTGTGGESIWGMPFGDEVTTNLRHIRGALSMANSGPFTNGSQFFIVQKYDMMEHEILEKEEILEYQDMEIEEGYYVSDIWPAEFMEHYLEHGGTSWLDFNHSVFGQVFYGMDVVDAIANTDVVDTVPVEPVVIERIEIAVR